MIDPLREQRDARRMSIGSVALRNVVAMKHFSRANRAFCVRKFYKYTNSTIIVRGCSVIIVIYVTYINRKVFLSSKNGCESSKKPVQQWTNQSRDNQSSRTDENVESVTVHYRNL